MVHVPLVAVVVQDVPDVVVVQVIVGHLVMMHALLLVLHLQAEVVAVVVGVAAEAVKILVVRAVGVVARVLVMQLVVGTAKVVAAGIVIPDAVVVAVVQLHALMVVKVNVVGIVVMYAQKHALPVAVVALDVVAGVLLVVIADAKLVVVDAVVVLDVLGVVLRVLDVVVAQEGVLLVVIIHVLQDVPRLALAADQVVLRDVVVDVLDVLLVVKGVAKAVVILPAHQPAILLVLINALEPLQILLYKKFKKVKRK